MGKEDIETLKSRLLDLLKKKAVKTGRVVLSSGKVSDFYIDGRLITLEPEGAWLVANIILEIIRDMHCTAVGGPTLGADPVVGAIACIAHQEQIPLKTFIVRKAVKEHGMGRQIEGPLLDKADKVIILDDVATSGRSLIEAKAALEKEGIQVGVAVVIVDRQEGALENLAQHGIKLISIFNKNSFKV